MKTSSFCGMLWLTLGSGVAVGLLLLSQHETVRVTGYGGSIVIGTTLGCAMLRQMCRHSTDRRRRVLGDLAEYTGFFTLICVMGAVASYPDAASSSGTVDPMLQHADRLLRFDWVRLYAFVADHRILQIAGMMAYQSIYLTPVVLIASFAWHGRRAEAYRFLLSFWLAAVITLVLFRWLPAAGPLAYLWHAPIPYMPQSALYQAQLVPALQGHMISTIDADALHGLVSAPSFHAASAVIYIAFARRVPRLGGLLVVVNLLMIASTPIEGTHYLIDVIGGILVAFAALAATNLGRMTVRLDGARARSLAPA